MFDRERIHIHNELKRRKKKSKRRKRAKLSKKEREKKKEMEKLKKQLDPASTFSKSTKHITKAQSYNKRKCPFSNH